ncbi:MAG: YihY/virulence factor BrkB family protein [Chloroflexota bacterium]
MQKPNLRLTRQIFRLVIETIHTALNYVTGGIYGIIVDAIREFVAHRALDAAAGIAYYAIFSLFPLLIILVTTLGAVLNPVLVQVEIVKLIQEFFPFSETVASELVSQNLQVITASSGSIGIFAAVGLLWAGSNVFTVLANNINRAWHIKGPAHSLVRSRIIGFTMISLIAGFLIFSLLSTLLLNIVAQLRIGTIALDQTLFWIFMSKIVSYVFSFALFLSIYRWVPNTTVRWLEAGVAALVATISWRLAFTAFTWSINLGVVNYQWIYGSLASVVLAVFWIYLGSIILIFCAYLCAAIARKYRPTEQRPHSESLR